MTGIAILEALPEEVTGSIEGVPVRANYATFMDWLRQAALDEVYLDVSVESEESLLPYLKEMESMGLTVHFRLPLLDRIEKACSGETGAVRISRELSRCAGGNVVTMGTVELKLRDQILKRALDLVGGLVGCILSIPIIAIVAIPLKLESPGPLVFKQRRVGRNGRVFYIHKLRSMYVDAEERKKELMARNEMNGLMFKMEDDPRITKVGRFRRTSIDELPQFFDVVRGSMSLVGTRPPTLDEYKAVREPPQAAPVHEARRPSRHRVRQRGARQHDPAVPGTEKGVLLLCGPEGYHQGLYLCQGVGAVLPLPDDRPLLPRGRAVQLHL